MKKSKSIFIIAISVISFQCINAQSSNAVLNSETKEITNARVNNTHQAAEILNSYVEDFRNDRFASEVAIFGIEVPDQGAWTVTVTGKKTDSGWEVLLNDGLPAQPTFVYQIEGETLKAIDEGKINALTAQGKAFAGDYTPMSIDLMDGFEPTMEEYGAINPFSFHFWTKGIPEIVPFGAGMTRSAHGSNFVVFYYETGLRTAWYRVLPNERVRDDAREQAAPFPMLIVAIEGTTEGEVGGKRVSLSKGNTIFIPANTAHKWWNETTEATEAILIMFGKGA